MVVHSGGDACETAPPSRRAARSHENMAPHMGATRSERRGRRANLILPVPPAYQQVLADRLSKYRRWYNEHGDSDEDSDSNEED